MILWNITKRLYFCTIVYATIIYQTILMLQNDEIFDILAGKISTAINRTFLRAFAAEGIEISTEQWSVLACLWKKDKVTQQTLCNLTAKDKPSMTRLIDKLEKNKLVTRVSDFSDRRINLIHLTDSGAALQLKATELVQSIVEKTLCSIPEEDLLTSREVLRKIMANLK